MRFKPLLFALLLSLGVLGTRTASAQVVISARIGAPYYAPRPYYGRGYYPPVAPVVVAPPPVVVYPQPYYYAPRPYYAPRYYAPRGRGYGRGYGRRW